METPLKQACADHDLTGIGVNVFGAPAKAYIGVYLHWKTGDPNAATCCSGDGQTFDEAFAAALAEMAERRAADVVPPVQVGPVCAEFLGLDFEDRSGECA